MKGAALLMIALIAIGGCARGTKILSLEGDENVEFPGVQDLIHGKPKIVIIFLHGVGDHCPLYALDEKSGWIGERAFQELAQAWSQDRSSGAAPIDRVETPLYVSSQNFKGISFGQADPDSVYLGKLRVARRTLRGRAGESAPSVDAVEITWSDLTYAVKDAQLVYDFTEQGREHYVKATGKGAAGHDDQKTGVNLSCFWPSSDVFVPSHVPSRVLVNRTIKETILDRNMADAILYAGPFNRILQHAVAEGICDAITSTDSATTGGLRTEPCDWQHAQEVIERRDTVYFIVTHSLGSRMLYNVLINLNDQDWYGDSAFDVQGADAKASEVIRVFTCQMPAVYMMANQYSLLGLASRGTVANIIANDPKSLSKAQLHAFLPGLTGRDASAGRRGEITPIACGSAEGADDAIPTGSKPTFVAFTDSNDLLSWPIRPDMDQSNFTFFNVFVDNTRWHWFGLYEDAGTAHGGYFDNGDVGKLMECGVARSQIQQTCGAKSQKSMRP